MLNSAHLLLWVLMRQSSLQPLWLVPPVSPLCHVPSVVLVPRLVGPVLCALGLPLPQQCALSMWRCLCETVLADSLKTGLFICCPFTALRRVISHTHLHTAATLLFSTSVQVMAPSLPHPDIWTCRPLVEDLHQLLQTLPQGMGVASDVVWALSLPVLQRLLVDRREQYSECALEALAALSSACQASTASHQQVSSWY